MATSTPPPPPTPSPAALASPLAVVDALFASAGRPSVDGDWGVAAYFAAVAADPALAAQVPDVATVNLDTLPPNCLVKFRGMVQHQGNPEFFFGAFPAADGTVRTVKFADAAADADDAAAMGAAIAAHGPHPCAAAGGAGGTAGAAPIWQRQALYCTAIPGEPAPVVVVGGAPTRATTTAAAAAAAAAPKRAREEDAAAGDAMDADDGGATAQPTAKTAKAGAAAAPPPQLQPAFPPPAPGDCVVFVYPAGGDGSGRPAAHALPAAPRLNEIVEVWGVLSRTPDPGCLGGGCEGGADDDDDGGAAALAAATAWGGLPPSSLVPRVHALLLRPAPALPPHHVAAAAAVGGPVSPLTIPPRSLAPPHPAAPAARAAAAGALAAALGGDALAAEYLLLQLVSRARAADVGGAGGVSAGLASLAPGVLALNLCGCPTAEPAAPGGAASSALSPFAARLAATLAALAPRCIALPVTVPALNAPPAGRFRPAACPATDRLRPRAPLQVAPATQVLLDETALAPGKLTPAGLDNARALQELLADKAVGYEFGAGARVPMPADAAVTVLSGATSSVLRSSVDLVLPLDPACAASAGAAAGAPPPLPPPDAAALARALFAGARACDGFDLGANGQCEAVPPPAPAPAASGGESGTDGEAPSPPVVDWIVDWMAATRAASGGGSGEAAAAAAADLQGALHRTVELARLLALSHGEGGLSKDRWDGAVAMEAARAARVADRLRAVRGGAARA